MIEVVETLIVVGGVVLVASLGFADRTLKRIAKEDASDDPLAEPRRVLERQRAEWIRAANSTPHSDDRQTFLNKAAKVDEELVKLANSTHAFPDP